MQASTFGDERLRGDAGTGVWTVGRLALGSGALCLGVIGLVVGDFALQWQPVPDGLPGRTPLAYASAALLTVLGAALLMERAGGLAARAFTGVALLWAVVLQGRELLLAPLDVLAWLSLAEILAIAAGTLTLAACRLPDELLKRRLRMGARMLFGACLPVFGWSHFAYPDFTAGMIPAWVPLPLFWAYATGIGHAAAGVAILTGVLASTAAVLFASMVSSFVLLLHVPGVIVEPSSRQQWTMLAIATLITGAAWLVAGAMIRSRRLRRES